MNVAGINRTVPGYRLQSGDKINEMIDQINNVTGNGTPGAVTGTSITSSTFFRKSTTNALTAVGTNRATALALTTELNVVATAASGTGVVLPAASTVGIGGQVIIFNQEATNAIKVYAAGSDTIDGTAGSTGVTLSNTKRCAYFVNASGTFISAQLGVVSA